MIISIDVEKAFGQIQYQLMIKLSARKKKRRKPPQCNKGYLQKTFS